MAKEQDFFPQNIDRTPYKAFIWVILSALLLYFLLAILFWDLARLVKNNTSKNSISIPNSTNLIEQAKNKAQKVEDQALQSVQNKAKTSTNQIKQQTQNSLNQQVNQSLKQYLTP